MSVNPPYLMFLGDAADQLAAKTAAGVVHWRPEICLGQMRLEGCNADLGIPDMSLEKAAAEGVKTLIVGVANRGGVISQTWVDVLVNALELGLDLASGLHNRLIETPMIREAAAKHGRQLTDVRHPTRTFSVGSGKKRGVMTSEMCTRASRRFWIVDYFYWSTCQRNVCNKRLTKRFNRLTVNG